MPISPSRHCERTSIAEQDRRHVTLYSRELGGAWSREEVVSSGAMMLPCPATVLTLDDVYEGVELPPAAVRENADWEDKLTRSQARRAFPPRDRSESYSGLPPTRAANVSSRHCFCCSARRNVATRAKASRARARPLDDDRRRGRATRRHHRRRRRGSRSHNSHLGTGKLVVGKGPVRTGVTVVHPRGERSNDARVRRVVHAQTATAR